MLKGIEIKYTLRLTNCWEENGREGPTLQRTLPTVRPTSRGTDFYKTQSSGAAVFIGSRINSRVHCCANVSIDQKPPWWRTINVGRYMVLLDSTPLLLPLRPSCTPSTFRGDFQGLGLPSGPGTSSSFVSLFWSLVNGDPAIACSHFTRVLCIPSCVKTFSHTVARRSPPSQEDPACVWP